MLQKITLYKTKFTLNVFEIHSIWTKIHENINFHIEGLHIEKEKVTLIDKNKALYMDSL